ncbi:MAG: hypothetical protein QXT14_08945 [Candidatus Bathyarchaeia archaeon]
MRIDIVELTDDEIEQLGDRIMALLSTIADISGRKSNNVVKFKMLSTDLLLVAIGFMLETHLKTVNAIVLKFSSKEKGDES